MLDIIEEINRLRREKGAVILAHTYQPSEIQEIADFVGDSYALAVKASQLQDARLIVFCGVRFMAETAAILNPGKRVVMPDADAGCPMADMITGEQLAAFKREHPGAPVVCYVNSTAEVKAESTICCTSSNAMKVVRSLGNPPEILFVPDQCLGDYIGRQLGVNMVLWKGCCPIHFALTPEQIREARRLHPNAKVMVHPETRRDVQAEADHILSTGQMIDLVRGTAGEYIVGTECGIMHALKLAAPQAVFHSLRPEPVCKDMKKTTLEKLRKCLETESPVITVPDEVARRARKSIENMLNA